MVAAQTRRPMCSVLLTPTGLKRSARSRDFLEISNEGMVIDHAGKKLYVNLTGSDEIGVIDLMTRALVARWPLPDAHVAHAIALDEPNHRLFTASRKPAEFIVFNSDTGKVISTIPCVGVNSDMSLDVAHKRIYVTGR